MAGGKDDARDLIDRGRATLGIELGSTRIKATLIGDDFAPIASGSHEWDNEYVEGRWTYSLEAIWHGLQACYRALADDTEERFGVRPESFRAIGVSAMMHGYLALDADGELLVPFRTWRNTSTGPAAAALSEALGFNIPLRWSIAHLYQAVLDDEAHVAQIASLTTLAGYVHWKLTGRQVVGVGDASGMFPIDPATRDFDASMLAIAQERIPALDLADLLPEVLVAGQDAGRLTNAGARLLDPSGRLAAGSPLAPPEGDAGTGMVATQSVRRRSGNVSVGTSIFAMVVLEEQLGAPHEELDVVTTPAGDAVAMVHCNNGASEIASWARVFGRFAAASGNPLDADHVYATLLDEALASDPDAGGLLSYNLLAGEPVVGVEEGRPLLLRTPDGSFTLGNLVRSEVYAAFSALAIGMEVLAGEGVAVDRMLAHGGLFRTPGAAQRLLAAALDVPVAVGSTAGEGGPWGMAILAAYLESAAESSLDEFLDNVVFTNASIDVVEPDQADRAGFETYLGRYRKGLALQPLAVNATTSLQIEKEPTE
jgi:sugar (pentulose or hexulose) kinase